VPEHSCNTTHQLDERAEVAGLLVDSIVMDLLLAVGKLTDLTASHCD
jgi:hypothetical protein